MPAGRPTDYSPEILEKSKEYLKNYSKLGDRIPNIEGLAVVLGLTRQTIHDWNRQGKQEGNEKREFSYIIEDILSQQGRTLINKGLDGGFQPTIAKLLLHKHGYKEESEVSGPEGGPIPLSITEQIKKVYGPGSQPDSNSV